MYSGFITKNHASKRLGIHQKFNASAYRLVAPMLRDQAFPTLKQIQHFEGVNGPDGLKLKSPGEFEPDHMYDPAIGRGEILKHIANHYQHLVEALKDQDQVRAAFEASWLAHSVTDGLTPAHQFPLQKHMNKLREGSESPENYSWRHKGLVRTGHMFESIRRNWAMWGKKGLLITHINFEMGVAATLLLFNIKATLEWSKLNLAWKLGPVKFFKREATEVADLKLYDRFYSKGWTAELGHAIKTELAPITAQTIGTLWLLAYLEADLAGMPNKLSRASLAELQPAAS